MGKQLTDKAIQQFHERGYYSPLVVASVEEIQEMRRRVVLDSLITILANQDL